MGLKISGDRISGEEATYINMYGGGDATTYLLSGATQADLETAIANYDIIHLPAGTITITSKVEITKGEPVSIIGIPNKSILQTNINNYMLTTNSSTLLRLEGITFINTESIFGNHGIELEADYSSVINCKFLNPYATANTVIDVEADNITIKDTIINFAKWAILITSGHHYTKIINCKITNSETAGIQCSGNNSHFLENTVDKITIYGDNIFILDSIISTSLSLESSSAANIVSNNYFGTVGTITDSGTNNNKIGNTNQSGLNSALNSLSLDTTTTLGTDDTKIPSQNAVKVYADNLLSTLGSPLIFKGTHDASTTNYPSSPSTGDYWKISVAGTISGTDYAIGDAIIYNGSTWDKIDNTNDELVTHEADTSTHGVSEVAGTADIATHTSDDDAHHAVYEQSNATSDIATHAALPAVHQDAPALILAHKNDADAHQDAPALIATHTADNDAHHTKYTDGEVESVITAEIVGGQSIDNAIDSLIATHAAASDSHYRIGKHVFLTGVGGTSLLQSALNACVDGDTVHLPSGNIPLAASGITISKEIKLVGSGIGGTSFSWSGGANNQILLITAADVQIKEIYFYQNNLADNAIYSTGNFTRIENCRFYGAIVENTAIKLDGDHCLVKDCRIQHKDYGVNLVGDNNHVVNNVFDNIDEAMVLISGDKNIIMGNYLLANSTAYKVDIVSGGDYNLVLGNKADDATGNRDNGANNTLTETMGSTAASVSVDTSSFSNNFSNDASHDTVQECLDIIDDLALGGGGTAATTTVVTTAFNNNFANDSSHDTVQEVLDILDDMTIIGSLGDLGINATSTEINNVCDISVGSTVKNAHTHTANTAAEVSVVTTAFGTNFANNAAHDNVQKLMDIIDDLSLGGYTHPTTDGNKHVPANSTTNDGKVLTASGVAGTYTWETAAGGGGGDLVDDETPQLGGDLDINGKQILITVTHNVADGYCVYMSGTTPTLADADASASMPCIGIVESNTNNTIVVGGIYTHGSAIFTAGAIVYVGTDGLPTTTAPSGSGDQLQRIGVALTTTTMIVHISLDVIELA